MDLTKNIEEFKKVQREIEVKLEKYYKYYNKILSGVNINDDISLTKYMQNKIKLIKYKNILNNETRKILNKFFPTISFQLNSESIYNPYINKNTSILYNYPESIYLQILQKTINLQKTVVKENQDIFRSLFNPYINSKVNTCIYYLKVNESDFNCFQIKNAFYTVISGEKFYILNGLDDQILKMFNHIKLNILNKSFYLYYLQKISEDFIESHCIQPDYSLLMSNWLKMGIITNKPYDCMGNINGLNPNLISDQIDIPFINLKGIYYYNRKTHTQIQIGPYNLLNDIKNKQYMKKSKLKEIEFSPPEGEFKIINKVCIIPDNTLESENNLNLLFIKARSDVERIYPSIFKYKYKELLGILNEFESKTIDIRTGKSYTNKIYLLSLLLFKEGTIKENKINKEMLFWNKAF
jgi:hypothetical protein